MPIELNRSIDGAVYSTEFPPIGGNEVLDEKLKTRILRGAGLKVENNVYKLPPFVANMFNKSYFESMKAVIDNLKPSEKEIEDFERKKKELEKKLVEAEFRLDEILEEEKRNEILDEICRLTSELLGLNVSSSSVNYV